jgi:putative ABC transport system permease protein
MNEVLRDFRYAMRGLIKSPGVTAVAVLALALGIGVNTSSFTAVNTIVLHPLPYAHLEQVMTLWETLPKLRAERDTVSPANLLDWKEQSRSFQQIAAYRRWDVSLTGVEDPERVQGYLVTPSFFTLLGMQPILGRTFSDDEGEPAHDSVVVLSRGFWQRRLASAPDAVGRTISLGGRTFTIVGVMPVDFDFPLATDLWAPLALTSEEKHQRAARNLVVLARLKREIPIAQARAEMQTIARRLQQQYPQTNEARGVLVVPLRELTNNVADRFVLILLACAVFVLLLACANVANLQLARATARQKEIALRTALGASRFRIARQLLAESILVALLGGSVGLFLASWNLDLTRASFPASVLRWMAGLRNMRIDSTVLMFTLAASLAAGVLCSFPAIAQLLLRKRMGDPNEILKEGSRGSSAGSARGRLQNALVISEVALALVLLVGAGLMVKTFQSMLTLNAGFNSKNLLTMQVALPALKYRDNAQMVAFTGEVLQGLETLPEMKAAGAVSYWGTAEGVHIEGRLEPRPGEPLPGTEAVSEHYLQAMEIPVLQGRSISVQDGTESPRVVVLSETIARHYWPGYPKTPDPIGRRIKLGNPQSPWLTVIGVSGDIKQWFTGEPMPMVYIPYLQAPRRSVSLYMRTASDPMRAASGARAKVRNVDANQAVYDVKSMEQVLSEETSGVRVSATTMSMYAVIALLLAITGIYAVISYSVVQRTHEIGVRMALGAARSDVLKMTLWRAFRLAGIGLAIGVPIALALTKLMSSVLYNVVSFDAFAFVGFTVVLGSSALLAGYIPARRASKVDPVIALRHE